MEIIDDADDIDKLYEQALDRELGDSRKNTNKVRTAIYQGELAFALQVHCIKPDVPPSTYRIDPANGENTSYYKFQMIGLNHDMAMYVLTHLKDVFPISTCQNSMISTSYGSRRNSARKELESLGISHMGQWITCCKDGTYTICIRHLSYSSCSKVCKALFEW